MTEQKYPAELVEKAAKAIAEHKEVYDYGLDQMVCACGDRYTGRLLAKHRAVAVLDALGLIVTEEWGIDYGDPDLSTEGPRREPTRERAVRQHERFGLPLFSRTFLYAKTDWKVTE